MVVVSVDHAWDDFRSVVAEYYKGRVSAAVAVECACRVWDAWTETCEVPEALYWFCRRELERTGEYRWGMSIEGVVHAVACQQPAASPKSAVLGLMLLAAEPAE